MDDVDQISNRSDWRNKLQMFSVLFRFVSFCFGVFLFLFVCLFGFFFVIFNNRFANFSYFFFVHFGYLKQERPDIEMRVQDWPLNEMISSTFDRRGYQVAMSYTTHASSFIPTSIENRTTVRYRFHWNNNNTTTTSQQVFVTLSFQNEYKYYEDWDFETSMISCAVFYK